MDEKRFRTRRSRGALINAGSYSYRNLLIQVLPAQMTAPVIQHPIAIGMVPASRKRWLIRLSYSSVSLPEMLLSFLSNKKRTWAYLTRKTHPALHTHAVHTTRAIRYRCVILSESSAIVAYIVGRSPCECCARARVCVCSNISFCVWVRLRRRASASSAGGCWPFMACVNG